MKRLNTLTLTALISIAAVFAAPTAMADPIFDSFTDSNDPAAICLLLKRLDLLELVGFKNQGQCVKAVVAALKG